MKKYGSGMGLAYLKYYQFDESVYLFQQMPLISNPMTRTIISNIAYAYYLKGDKDKSSR